MFVFFNEEWNEEEIRKGDFNIPGVDGVTKSTNTDKKQKEV